MAAQVAAGRVAASPALQDAANAGGAAADQYMLNGVPFLTGSAFVDNVDFRAWTLHTFEARVLDMESAAVAHVAYANGVPFLAVGSLRDLAGGGEGANEIGTFLQRAADNLAAVVRALIAALP